MINYALIAKIGLDRSRPFTPQLEALGFRSLGESTAWTKGDGNEAASAGCTELLGNTSGFHLWADAEAKVYFYFHSGD